MIPLPPATRRPCALIGLSLALVFSAAIIDAFFWQQGVERDEMRSQVAAAQVHAEMLAAENAELRQEMARLRLELLSVEVDLVDPADAVPGCLRNPFKTEHDDGDCERSAIEQSEHHRVQHELKRAELERLVNGLPDY